MGSLVIKFKIFSHVKSWQLVSGIVVIVLVAIAAAGYEYTNNHPPILGKEINSTSGAKLKVVGATPQVLDNNISITDIPPSTSSAALQTPNNNPGESSNSPLQSNTNINDPNVANNPLVQSLLINTGD